MKTNAKKLLSLLLALLMLIPGAMAEETKFAAFLNAEISADNVEIPALTDALTLDEMNFSNQLTEESVTFMVENIHWFCAVYQDPQNVIKEWCVPVAVSDDSYLYMVQVGSMAGNLDGDPDAWAVCDQAIENVEAAQIAYVSEDTETILVESVLPPSAGFKSCVDDASGMTGYGFRFVEEDGESKLSIGIATMEKNGAHYTVPNGTFEVSSPVYTEDGKLIGISDGGVYVYSYEGILNEATGEEPAAEPADEPANEPVAAPAEEPADEPAEEPADEPEEKPTQKPAEPEEDDEPAPASKGNDKGIDKNVIIGVVAVVVVAGAYFLNKKKKAEAAKKDAQQPAPERPVYNQKPSTPKAPAQETAVTQPAGKTMLVTEVPKAPEKPQKRTVVGIRCVSGSQAGANFRIEREVRIGRDPQRCSIIMPKDTRGISGLHCSVEPTSDGAIKLIDLGSTYGTFVNGQKMNANTPRILRAGERFELADGGNRFEVYTEEI